MELYLNNLVNRTSKQRKSYVFMPSKALTRISSNVHGIIAFSNKKTTSKIVPRVKSSIPQLIQCNVIYKISSKVYDSIYIGQTSYYLHIRIKVHQHSTKAPTFASTN